MRIMSIIRVCTGDNSMGKIGINTAWLIHLLGIWLVDDRFDMSLRGSKMNQLGGIQVGGEQCGILMGGRS